MCTFRFGFLSASYASLYLRNISSMSSQLTWIWKKCNFIICVALVADGMVLFISQAKWCCNCWFDSINLAICLFNFSAEKATQNISFETWAILFSLSVFVNIENSLLHNFDVHCKKFSTLFTNYMKLCSKIPKQFL